jgi:hypothetical protein
LWCPSYFENGEKEEEEEKKTQTVGGQNTGRVELNNNSVNLTPKNIYPKYEYLSEQLNISLLRKKFLDFKCTGGDYYFCSCCLV